MILVKSVRKKLRKVKLIVCDVDGTLARRIYLNHRGEEIKVFCEKDAPRIAAVVQNNIPFVMISGRDSSAARARAKELKVDFYSRAEMLAKKNDPLEFLESKYGVNRSKILYIGDDWSDLWWMREAGISAAPHDAEETCRSVADIVTESNGGEGAVSEILVLLLKAKRLYEQILKNQFQSPAK